MKTLQKKEDWASSVEPHQYFTGSYEKTVSNFKIQKLLLNGVLQKWVFY